MNPLMTDIRDFIAARIDEDQALAQAAIDDVNGEDCWFDTGNEHIADHYRRHSTDRVLREVATTRAILARWEHLHWQFGEIQTDPSLRGGLQSVLSSINTIEAIMKRIALTHEDHPDFKDEWRLPSPDWW